MSAKRGRPVRVAMRRWLNDEVYLAKITSIVDARDKTNEETVTNVTYALEALARETVPAEALSTQRIEALRGSPATRRPRSSLALSSVGVLASRIVSSARFSTGRTSRRSLRICWA